MKYLIFALSAMFLISCASNTKKEVTATATEKSTTAKTAADDSKKLVKSAKASQVTKAADSAQKTVTCTYGEIKRELSVVDSDGTCKVEYTKDGNTQEIATGIAGSAFCGEVVDRVKGKLEAAGYTCQ